jgi:hypothetical protein
VPVPGSFGWRRRPDPPSEPSTFSISDARESLDDEMHHRMKRYLISMGIRTLCFVLAVVLHGWLRWTMAAAAVVLPYIAVVMANAGPSRSVRSASRYAPGVAASGGGAARPIATEHHE